MARQLFYALEVTYEKPELGAITQIGGVFVVGGEPVDSFLLDIQPHCGAVIDRNALLAAGTTVENLMAKGEKPDVAHRRLCRAILGQLQQCEEGESLFLCSFGGGHRDNGFLARFFRLNGNSQFCDWFWPCDIDVRQLACDFLQDDCQRMGGFGLQAVGERLGIKADPARLHDAYYNAWLAYEIYRRVTTHTIRR